MISPSPSHRRDYLLPGGKLSPSRVNKARGCMACFFHAYVEPAARPDSAGLMIGGSIHEGIESLRRLLLKVQDDLDVGGPPLREFAAAALDAAEGAWNERVQETLAKDLPPDLEGYPDWGKAKDDVFRILRFALPEIVRNDLSAGIQAVEVRIHGLGTPMDADEAAGGYEPIFPFPFEAYCDVLYRNATMKDTKTGKDAKPPTFEHQLQQLLYGLPWHRAGSPQRLGIEKITKQVSPQYLTWWLNPGPSAYDAAVRLVLSTADMIDRAMHTGDFPPSPSYLCDFEHGFGTYARAVDE